jgi:hypothetical protein
VPNALRDGISVYPIKLNVLLVSRKETTRTVVIAKLSALQTALCALQYQLAQSVRPGISLTFRANVNLAETTVIAARTKLLVTSATMSLCLFPPADVFVLRRTRAG